MEKNEESSGFEFDEQPSEATKWAEEAEAEGDESGFDPDEDLDELGDDSDEL